MTEQTVTSETPEELQSSQVDTPDEGTDDAREDVQDDVEGRQQDSDTFPRHYVQKLREENKKYRLHAADRDDLAHRLHTAYVQATGRLADAADLEFNEAHLTDLDALHAAIEDLLARKPHLAPRRPRGSVGQGATGDSGTVDLAAMLRSRA